MFLLSASFALACELASLPADIIIPGQGWGCELARGGRGVTKASHMQDGEGPSSFVKGSRVLCYHGPLLYEAKVLHGALLFTPTAARASFRCGDFP